ncbi:hypothetical protein MBLNU459_g5709t1 [Dothideomycetes sp. NU459]
MVLDYSKINAFAKTQSPASNLFSTQAQVVKGGTEPLLNIYSSVNIAAIVEEVVEGIATGHLAKDTSNLRFDNNQSSSPRSSGWESGSGGTNRSETPVATINRPPVEIILDISPPSDWLFITQPGAFRRVLMNLFGNALKYTERGFIRVSLSHANTDVEPSLPLSNIPAGTPGTAMVTLSVVDSGKGISQSFMETKMFTPFSQENPMAPGIGLGLSLAHSIVKMLNGEIHIASKLDIGTTVTVNIPLERPLRETAARNQKLKYRAIDAIKQIRPRPRVAIYQTSLPGDIQQQEEAHRMQGQALSTYIGGWYDFGALEEWDASPAPDIIFVDEIHLPVIIERIRALGSAASTTVVVVICEDTSRTTAFNDTFDCIVLESIVKPFGPYKLAKVLRLVLDRAIETRTEPNSRMDYELDKEHSENTEYRSIEDVQIEGMEDHDFGIATATLLRRAAKGLTCAPTPGRIFASSEEGFPFPLIGFTAALSAATPSAISPQVELSASHNHRRIKSAESHTITPNRTGVGPSLPRRRSDSHVSFAESRQRQPTLLLVDDNEVNLKLLQTYVVRRLYTCVTLARDGAQAVAAYERALYTDMPIDVIFMDISMPIMDGFEATRRIRDLESSLAAAREASTLTSHKALIVAITGNASANDQAMAFIHGIDLYMTKPVSLKETGKLLQQWETKCREYGCEGVRDAILAPDATPMQEVH